MARMVHCTKLDKDLPGLDSAPMKGPLGDKIYNEISAEAWKSWVSHSVMIINEYRLNPSDPEAAAKLTQQMIDFLFGEGSELPPDYVAPKA